MKQIDTMNRSYCMCWSQDSGTLLVRGRDSKVGSAYLGSLIIEPRWQVLFSMLTRYSTLESTGHANERLTGSGYRRRGTETESRAEAWTDCNGAGPTDRVSVLGKMDPHLEEKAPIASIKVDTTESRCASRVAVRCCHWRSA